MLSRHKTSAYHSPHHALVGQIISYFSLREHGYAVFSQRLLPSTCSRHLEQILRTSELTDHPSSSGHSAEHGLRDASSLFRGSILAWGSVLRGWDKRRAGRLTRTTRTKSSSLTRTKRSTSLRGPTADGRSAYIMTLISKQRSAKM